MARCDATLDLYGETYRCDRKHRHSGKHRERLYGADERGQYVARVRWRRHPYSTEPRLVPIVGAGRGVFVCPGLCTYTHFTPRNP